MSFLRGVCTGSSCGCLIGKTALIKLVGAGYHVQFDDRDLGSWAFNWHWFAKSEFELLPPAFDTNPGCVDDDQVRGSKTDCEKCGGTGLHEDFLIKSEEEGAPSVFDQMKNANEIRATGEALKKAGYTELPDGTFEGKFFKATITSDKCEANPNQRRVEYVKKAKF